MKSLIGFSLSLFPSPDLNSTMRAWIFVLAVLATFQVIVQVASTEDFVAAKIKMVESQQLPSKSKSHRHRISSSPVLSFAAIVAEKSSKQQEEEEEDGQFSLTNSNNIVLNSDNVQHPAHETNSVLTEQQVQLLVPTNFKSSSPSANSVVNKSNISNSSGNSNSIDSGKRRHRTRVQRARRRRQRLRQRLQKSQDLAESSLQRSSSQEKRINSNELNVEEELDEEEQEDITVAKEDRAKPDPETLVTIEKNLLSLFGFKKRPKIDRSKVVIPEAMRRMYAETTGMELDLPDLPKPAIHRAHYTANTVRSFTHEGESSGFDCEIIVLRTANCCSESLLCLGGFRK